MRRGWLCGLALIMFTASCGGTEPAVSNRFGNCVFEPHTVCTGQDLEAVSMAFADLTGADLSGANLSDADLHGAILRNAKFVNTNLGGADLTQADLRGADLSGTLLYAANLDNADWEGSQKSTIKTCNTVLPDGSISDCISITSKLPPSAKPPPEVVRFGLEPPGRCITDAVGEGVEVFWSVRNASQVGFSVDGIRLRDDTEPSGVLRVPVPCDGREHTFEIQADGDKPPPATKSFTSRIAPGRPAPAP